MIFPLNDETPAKIQAHPQWTTVQQQWFVLKVICPRCQRKSDVSHISLAWIALSGIPSLSMLHPTSSPVELEGGLLMDVEGCSSPTAINSSPARSSLSGWWNLPTTAACHTIQEGLQTNASSMCLLYCSACGQELAQARGFEVYRKPSSAPVSSSIVSGHLEKQRCVITGNQGLNIFDINSRAEVLGYLFLPSYAGVGYVDVGNFCYF